MNIILAAINAKYIHSNLAIRCLQGYTLKKTGHPVSRMEFTINQHLDDIVREIYKAKPDMLGISCYIWNYEMVKYLVPLLKQLLPDCLLFLGGPEVSYSPEEALLETGCDLIITGEGEKPFARLVSAFWEGLPYTELPGIAFGPVSYTHLDVYKRQIPHILKIIHDISRSVHKAKKNSLIYCIFIKLLIE